MYHELMNQLIKHKEERYSSLISWFYNFSYLSQAKEQGYSAVLTLGSKAMTSATNLALQAVTKVNN